MSTISDIKGPIRARAGISINRVLLYATGGGIDHAFMNDLTLRTQYRYSGYGTFVD